MYKVKKCREQIMDLGTKGIRLATDRMEREELAEGGWVGSGGQVGGRRDDEAEAGGGSVEQSTGT